MNTFVPFFKSLVEYSISHGVNPYIFLSIYLASFPFYYLPIFKLKEHVKLLRDKNNPHRLSTFKKDIIKYIIINRLAWAAPYFYVLLWGYGLPMAFIVLVWGYIFLGVCLFVYKYRGVIDENRDSKRLWRWHN